MEAKLIMAELQKNADLTEAAAKSIFVQWVFGLPKGIEPREAAIEALDALPEQELTVSAAAFRSYLEACTWRITAPRRRRRVIH